MEEVLIGVEIRVIKNIKAPKKIIRCLFLYF